MGLLFVSIPTFIIGSCETFIPKRHRSNRTSLTFYLTAQHTAQTRSLAASGQRSKRISWREKGHLCLPPLPLDCSLIEKKNHFIFVRERRSIKSRYVTRTTHKHIHATIYILYSVCILRMKKMDMKWKSFAFFSSTPKKYYFLDSNFKVSENKKERGWPVPSASSFHRVNIWRRTIEEKEA